ncbi:hypothetical protein [Fibrobacter sp. UWH3]|uniref:hypothetical protein n=1 Tax=Fibrobacter sp. UWH3 TaxID=1964353 RepID=UPI000CC533A1|nr:hypothetical protein [Fibrobacter sp. UWH3]MCQ2099270.1 hypothetical protein [Fibrobacter sp.]MDO4946800.1 hypothetical protein [Fibrobacter sp.]
MHNILNIQRNNTLFGLLLAAAPAVFCAMLVGADSVVAAAAVTVAYLSVLVGERID